MDPGPLHGQCKLPAGTLIARAGWFPTGPMAMVGTVSVLYLVRHGQASFGTEDYDRLSARGKDQSRALGANLKRSGMSPARITSGSMKRQLQTARCATEAAAWGTPLDTDSGWDEFNASELINVLPENDPNAKTDARAFQRLLERASTRWASKGHDADYSETFGEFTRRVDEALDRALDSLGSGECAVVVSSSGAISWAAARLLDGGFPQWLALNRVTVNSGVTKIVAGSSGKTLVAFNEHGHLPRSWITYR